jgi:hypothetical protein
MTGNTLKEFLLQNLDFAIEYISLHYPFTETEVSERMPYLIQGDAFYSEYVPDACSVIRPAIGLSFNQNIAWTTALKRKWIVGWEMLYPHCSSAIGGYYMPILGQTIVWGNITPDTLHDIIPLHVHKEICNRQALCGQYYPDWDSGFSSEVFEDKVFSKLSPQELIDLFHQDKELVLYNDSIWQNTIKEVLTYDLVQIVIAACREHGIIDRPFSLNLGSG